MQFEESCDRLEKILDKMNSGKISLDESLAYYEEAHQLISACQKKLFEAEKRIEVLVKLRNGEMILDEEEKPVLENFSFPENL